MSVNLFVKKLTENATIPFKGSEFSAGYDLSSAYNYVVPARGKALVLTDLAFGIPKDCYGRIAPRSSLAWKNSIATGAGVIDSDYRGNVGIILFNHSDYYSQNIKVRKGDRIAQLILEKIATPSILQVEDLDDTIRGNGGYGSTGI